MNLSAFSLNKKFNTMELENSDEKDQKRSTSLGIQNNLTGKSKAKIKLRELKDVRELRGTMCMPKVEDFLPKK